MEKKNSKIYSRLKSLPFVIKDMVISDSSIINWPVLILLVIFFSSIFFIFIYVNNILYPNVLADDQSSLGLRTTSWTLAISFALIGLIVRGLFHLSAKRKLSEGFVAMTINVVDVLPKTPQVYSDIPSITTVQIPIKNEENVQEEAKILVSTIKKPDQPSPEILDQNPSLSDAEKDSDNVITMTPDFQTFATTFDSYMESHGLTGKNGHIFISLMVLSRMIVLEEQSSSPEFFALLGKFFARSSTVFDGSQLGNHSIDTLPEFIQVIKQAQRYPNEPHLVRIEGIEPLALTTCFAEFSDYAFFPNRTYTFQFQGESISIPNNLWFFISLKKGTSFFSIPAPIRQQITLFKGEFEKNLDAKPLEQEISYRFNYFQASRVLNPTYPSEHLSEDLWKKVDQWAQVMAQVNQYELSNETMIHIENAIITLLSLKVDPLVSLDIIFSAALLVHALPRSVKETYQKETDMQKFFESTFGRKTFTQSIVLFKQYKTWNG
jgi:hypothetical protein